MKIAPVNIFVHESLCHSIWSAHNNEETEWQSRHCLSSRSESPNPRKLTRSCFSDSWLELAASVALTSYLSVSQKTARYKGDSRGEDQNIQEVPENWGGVISSGSALLMPLSGYRSQLTYSKHFWWQAHLLFQCILLFQVSCYLNRFN